MARAIILLLDSFGIGGAPDAAMFGDAGSDTLGHIAEQCAVGLGDRQGLRQGPLLLPNLTSLGLVQAAKLATGQVPAGMDGDIQPIGLYACANEVSHGKDTPSGHWEIAGVPVLFDWGYFPEGEETFPADLLEQIYDAADLPGSLANCHASGTVVIDEFGAEHISSGKPIFYTSADSVFQIAAHENHFGLERLYSLCEIIRKLIDPLNIGRVIARPFVGDNAGEFQRTGNRRDYSVLPPEPTLLDRACNAGRMVIAVGKISDIFAHQGISEMRKADGNEAIFNTTISAMDAAGDGDIVFSNFVDFDMLYGHRRDVPGYAAALERFDARLPEIARKLKRDDLVVVTADHGCDPTWRGNDHTRERVPVLCFGSGVTAGSAGVRQTFADIGESIAAHLGLAPGPHGRSFL
ncbi:phosphopentomutase [Hoeflea prorocentri]|uniref:Phosphopentomutase n=1 Tax=Hoeflea prorocentri TaxID=1922333 RepID=A0A9X3ZJD7_9HYPH|nr:phosphopentomutase [Hoeflea prorocentri]MCY6382978.1 phosphopentomutase [Hoeflea prorocentri]MDA5400778.1 phosphopentomutase [Hoeflea prorocentri]